MTKRPRRAALGPIEALLLACLAIPVSAQERVEARLSSQSLPAGQPVELTLTATSEDAAVGAPDLAVLEPDFQVLDRRVERRVSVTNGRRREEVRLRLMLLPRRDGALTLPGIPFGSARSNPISLTIEPGLEQVQEPVGSQPAQSAIDLDPRIFEQPEMGGPGAPPTEWSWAFPPTAAPSASPFSYPSAGPSLDSSGMNVGTGSSAPPGMPQASSAPAPSPAPEVSPGTAANPWFWVSLGLAAALAGLLFSRRRTEPAPAPVRTEPSHDTEPTDPLVEALERVRNAYRHRDGGAAREALLAWGRLRWPEDPPGNLARLARRFPPPLREHITELEKAFFSPEPIHWEREPVPDALSTDWRPQTTAHAHGPSGATAA